MDELPQLLAIVDTPPLPAPPTPPPPPPVVPPPPPELFWIMVVDDSLAMPDLRSVVGRDALQAAVQELLQLNSPGLFIHIFCGNRVHITRGPVRLLSFPDGETLPLFEMPSETDIEADGFVGRREPLIQQPMGLDFGDEEPLEDDTETEDPPSHVAPVGGLIPRRRMLATPTVNNPAPDEPELFGPSS